MEQNAGKNHGGKMVAPIVIAVILCLYYLVFAAVCFFTPLPLWGKLLFGIIPLVLGGVVIYVLVERLREIQGGEEDDLSQY